MWTDIIDLRDFYASSLGQMTARLIRRRVREVWPNLTGEAVLGLGFAPPLLRAGLDEARHVVEPTSVYRDRRRQAHLHPVQHDRHLGCEGAQRPPCRTRRVHIVVGDDLDHVNMLQVGQNASR